MPGTRFLNERDERYTHRLEAFSDVVIGFSLAQLSLNFVIAVFWWALHRLFDEVFVPTRLTVVLNFINLGLLIWLIYELQLWVRFEGTADHVRATVSYVVTYAVVYGLLGILFAICARLRWEDLDAEQRARAVGSIGRIAGVNLGTLIWWAASQPLMERLQ
jgi:hypothetical protein